MIESFYCPPSDPSEFVKLICTNPDDPTPVILRGTFRGATSREDTPGERIWGILISTSREEVDNAIAHPTILTYNLIAGLFLDPRTIVCDATTGEGTTIHARQSASGAVLARTCLTG